MRRIFFSALALCAFSVPATAGEGHDGVAVAAHIFDMADQDDDGQLPPAVSAAAGLERYGVSFAGSDLDGDGVTTREEYLELYRAHHPPTDGSDV